MHRDSPLGHGFKAEHCSELVAQVPSAHGTGDVSGQPLSRSTPVFVRAQCRDDTTHCPLSHRKRNGSLQYCSSTQSFSAETHFFPLPAHRMGLSFEQPLAYATLSQESRHEPSRHNVLPPVTPKVAQVAFCTVELQVAAHTPSLHRV